MPGTFQAHVVFALFVVPGFLLRAGYLKSRAHGAARVDLYALDPWGARAASADGLLLRAHDARRTVLRQAGAGVAHRRRPCRGQVVAFDAGREDEGCVLAPRRIRAAAAPNRLGSGV